MKEFNATHSPPPLPTKTFSQMRPSPNFLQVTVDELQKKTMNQLKMRCCFFLTWVDLQEWCPPKKPICPCLQNPQYNKFWISSKNENESNFQRNQISKLSKKNYLLISSFNLGQSITRACAVVVVETLVVACSIIGFSVVVVTLGS